MIGYKKVKNKNFVKKWFSLHSKNMQMKEFSQKNKMMGTEAFSEFVFFSCISEFQYTHKVNIRKLKTNYIVID